MASTLYERFAATLLVMLEMKSDGVQETSSRVWESAMVTMYSVGPTKASLRLSLLTVRASGARSEPRATTLPSQSGTERNKQTLRLFTFINAL